LRRIECDRIVGGSYFEAWERPDGGMMIIPRQQYNKPINAIIAVRTLDSVFVIWPKGTTQRNGLLTTAGQRKAPQTGDWS
jgi:hypothetical protein